MRWLTQSLPSVCLGGAIAIATGPTACSAAIHALVVGINEYQHLPRLEGAVPDAQDIASALERIGASPLTVLLNEAASHDRIEAAWRRMVSEAQPNDTLIFTYAGHGGQEPEKIPGSEADGKDETFLLSDFQGDPATPQYRERIIDNEINAWFQEAGRKDLRVIFVADACHSGSMTRGADSRVPQSVRAVPPYGYAEPIQIEGAPGISEANLPNVTFFSATLDDRTAPEVMIDGRKRGALSWAFARALESGADRNGDGIITRAELEGYIIPAVRQASEAQQTPEVLPDTTRGDEPLLQNVPRLGPAVAVASSLPAARLRILGLKEDDADAVLATLIGATPAKPNAADLIWDAGKEVVLDSVGDVAAQKIGISQVQALVDKWRALSALKTIALGHFLQMWLLPNDNRHPVGQVIRFTSEPIRQPHVTAFDLAPDGSILFLYPLSRDRPSLALDMPYSLELKVVGPVGADHLVVIASSEPLFELHRKLRRGAQVAELPGILSSELQGIDYQIGIQGLYTTTAVGSEP
jgi:uncharacterized caspase-like protein